MSSTVTTPAVEIQNYVNGAWQKSSTTEFLNVTNPASGELIARTPISTKAARRPANAFSISLS
jgi:malonate-semialdehyde dehydrogenase (acetylating)/methylmalonate-semialdehyde dehydrogenase